MKRTCLPGSRRTLRTIFARRSSPAALASIDARGTLTIENSAATNIALTSRSVTMMMSGISTSDTLTFIRGVLVEPRRRDDHRRHLPVFHAFDLDGQFPHFEPFARFRKAPRDTYDEFTDGEVLRRPRAFHPHARALERQVARQSDASVAEAERQQPRRLEFVGDAAEQLADDV